jgi:hypothetical protein
VEGGLSSKCSEKATELNDSGFNEVVPISKDWTVSKGVESLHEKCTKMMISG